MTARRTVRGGGTTAAVVDGPKRGRVIAAGGCSIAAAALLAGAFYYPFLHAEWDLQFPAWMPDMLAVRVRRWFIERGRIPVGDHYLIEVIGGLLRAREYLVGGALLFFSVLFPAAKIVLALAVGTAGHRLPSEMRGRLVAALALTAKWSMADVFVVSIAIAFYKADGFQFRFESRPGVYCYAASALLSALAVTLLSVRRPIHPVPT